jgi:hypothetical protein
MHRLDRWLVGAFVAMFFWLMINPVLAGRIGFNGTVVLLLCVTWLMIARATRREDFEEIVREEAIAVTLQHRAAA